MNEILRDLWGLWRERKNLWLAPIMRVMLFLGILIVFVQGSALAPFVYTLFKYRFEDMGGIPTGRVVWLCI